MDLKRGCLKGVEWIQVAHIADSCEHGDKPSGSDTTGLVCLLDGYIHSYVRFSRFYILVRQQYLSAWY
jgi:hypothetical protein